MTAKKQQMHRVRKVRVLRADGGWANPGDVVSLEELQSPDSGLAQGVVVPATTAEVKAAEAKTAE